MTTPETMAAALRILAEEIQSEDGVASQCLLDAAEMIEEKTIRLNAASRQAKIYLKALKAIDRHNEGTGKMIRLKSAKIANDAIVEAKLPTRDYNIVDDLVETQSQLAELKEAAMEFKDSYDEDPYGPYIPLVTYKKLESLLK